MLSILAPVQIGCGGESEPWERSLFIDRFTKKVDNLVEEVFDSLGASKLQPGDVCHHVPWQAGNHQDDIKILNPAPFAINHSAYFHLYLHFTYLIIQEHLIKNYVSQDKYFSHVPSTLTSCRDGRQTLQVNIKNEIEPHNTPD
jgi:hypothetical protein